MSAEGQSPGILCNGQPHNLSLDICTSYNGNPTIMGHVPILAWILIAVTLSGTIWLLGSVAIFAKTWIFSAVVEVTELEDASKTSSYNSTVDSLWYPPRDTLINNLGAVTNDDGVYGFIFNDSSAPAGNDYYGGYNYCNMPHVNKKAYVKAPDEYTLEYVEAVRRRPHFLRKSFAILTQSRSIVITNAPRTQPTPSPTSPTAGTATMKVSSHTPALSTQPVTNPPLHTTPSTQALRTHSPQPASTAHANSRRSQEAV